MDRVVFCPNSDLMDKAFALAKEWGIPILCGESERTKELVFNRNSVSVIHIPIHNHFIFYPKSVKTNETHQITYVNEFAHCEAVNILVQRQDHHKIFTVRTKLTNPHGLIAALRFSDVGPYSVTAVLDEKVLCTLEIIVE